MQIFYKNFQNFKKYLISTFLLNVPPRTKILAMPLQYRTWVEFMYEILFDVFPSNQNSWVATGTTVMYNVHCTLQLYLCSTVFERAENGNAVLCNYIDFAVIFHKKKNFQYKFYNTLIAGRAEKNFAGRKFRRGWHLYYFNELFSQLSSSLISHHWLLISCEVSVLAYSYSD